MSDSHPVVAVGAVIIHDDKMLMIRRGKEPGKGLWSIPGGRVEHGEYLTDALQREVKEETDLDVSVDTLIGILEVVGDPHYVIHDYSAALTGSTDARAGGDVDEVEWVALDDIPNRDCTPRFLETMRAWGVLTEP
jgi:8-oxo-dGTP diphosphatase